MALADVDAQVTFISSVDSNGHTASPHSQVAQKWGDSLIGTASGTISYSFDALSGWTDLERETVSDALALWSAFANVTFAASSGGTGNVVFYRNAVVTGPGNPPSTATANHGIPGSPDVLPDGLSHAVVLGSVETTYLSNEPGNTFGGENPLGTNRHFDLIHEIGHVLGLGHAGPYNYDVNPLTQQFGPYDTRLWSVESYIDAGIAAQYSSVYPVTGTFWKDIRPSTPMTLDILALQRLYGAPTNSPLNGNDVFGYDSTITGPLAKFYDFDQAFREPVVTLFSTGTNNTLNLSKISSGMTINLEPGSFSSVAGLVNNIAIDFNTVIETAIGGAGNDKIKGNAFDNRLVGSTGSNTLTGGLGADEFAVSGNDIITDLGLGGADFFRVGSGASLLALVAETWAATSQTFNLGNTTIQANGHNVSLQQAFDTGRGYTLHNIGNDTAVVLLGSVREDSITGGNGDDWLFSVDGNDRMTGGLGRDRFIVDAGAVDIFDLGLGADEIIVDTAGTLRARLVADWTPTGATTNRGRVVLVADGHNIDLSHVSDAIPSPQGFTVSNQGHATAVTLVGSLRNDTITGGLGDDLLSGRRGGDTIDLGGGRDTVLDALADLNGDLISGFSPGDAIDVTGALIGRNNLSVTLGTSLATLAVGGVSFQIEGDFSNGEFLTAARGTGVDAHTTITFQNHLLELKEGVSVDPSKINGVVDQAFLTGGGAATFTLTLKSADSAYANTLGTYRVATDGTIFDVHVVFANTLGVAAGARTVSLGSPADGQKIGFFLIQDGFSRYGTLPDNLSFVVPGTLTAADLDSGLPPALRSNTLGQLDNAAIFHSFSTLNPGDVHQALSGVTMGGRELQIGFEDQFNGDNDFQDIVIGITTNADNLLVV
jgi:Ca2+-binding RTX toxin-like protein